MIQESEVTKCHDAVILCVPQPSHTIDAESGVMAMLCYVIENAFCGCLTDEEKSRAARWLSEKYAIAKGDSTHE